MNNIVNAISIGLTSGVTMSILMASAYPGHFGKASSADVSHSLQDSTRLL